MNQNGVTVSLSIAMLHTRSSITFKVHTYHLCLIRLQQIIQYIVTSLDVTCYFVFVRSDVYAVLQPYSAALIEICRFCYKIVCEKCSVHTSPESCTNGVPSFIQHFPLEHRTLLSKANMHLLLTHIILDFDPCHSDIPM